MEAASEVGDPQDAHKPIEPLPYYPQLCRILGGVTLAVVLVYLEIHHSAPEPAAGRKYAPAYLDCDQACAELRVSRRTLNIALEGLSVWWKNDSQRSAAARAGREFIAASPSFHVPLSARVRPYACVGSRAFLRPRTIAIHRNMQQIERILIESSIIPATQTGHEYTAESETPASAHSPCSPSAVLESVLQTKPVARGLAWGWSEDRRVAASARMTEFWAKWRETREKEAQNGPTRRL